VVHVTGLVNEPGIVTLPAGSRVVDAVEAAGGANDDADLSVLNLARQVGDGEQIVVSDDPPPAVPPAEQQPTAINLNTATIEQLETLPGVGPAIGGRIVEWRETHGYFTTVDELLEVSGIGERTFADIEPLVTV
jgi:competence protein ComEA